MPGSFYNHDFRDSPNLLKEAERRRFATNVLVVVGILSLVTIGAAAAIFYLTPREMIKDLLVNSGRLALSLVFLPIIFDHKLREGALGLGPTNVVAPILIGYYVLMQAGYMALFLIVGSRVNATVTLHAAVVAVLAYAVLYAALFINRANLGFIRTYLCFLAGDAAALVVLCFLFRFGTAEWIVAASTLFLAAWIIHYDSLKLYEAREDEPELAIIEVFTPILVLGELAALIERRRQW